MHQGRGFWPDLPARVGDYPNSLPQLITPAAPGGRASAPAQPLPGAPAQPCRGCSAQRSRRVFPACRGLPSLRAGFPGGTERSRASAGLASASRFFRIAATPGLCGASGPPGPGPGLAREFLSLSLCPSVAAAAVTLCPRPRRAPPARLGLAVPTRQRLWDGAREGRPFPPLHGTPRPSVGTVSCPLWDTPGPEPVGFGLWPKGFGCGGSSSGKLPSLEPFLPTPAGSECVSVRVCGGWSPPPAPHTSLFSMGSRMKGLKFQPES